MASLIDNGNNLPLPERPALEITACWVNPNSSSNLLAKVTVTNHRWGQTLADCSVVRTKNDGYFVFPPSALMIGKDGLVIKGQDGKPQYRPCVIWTKDAGQRFSEAVIKLLRASHPELFGGRQ